MEKSIAITLIIVAGIVIILGGAFLAYLYIMPSNTVTGNGQATINAVPDMVSIYFQVQTKNKSAQIAKDKNAEIVDNVITALVKERLERKDIETLNFNMYPEYSWENGQSRETGYVVVHNIRVKLLTEDTEKTGEIIDAGVDAGATIDYINFELSQEKQNQHKADALELAAEDARIKAEAVANGLGKKLGRLVSVSGSNFDYYPWPIYKAEESGTIAGATAEAKQAVTNIQPSEKEISASVSAVFKLRSF